MARAYLVFGDIEGNLDVLRVERAKCERKGRYSVAKLIEKHGPQEQYVSLGVRPERRLPEARRSHAGSVRSICPDLPKVL
jgi:hypothetical protein